MKRYICSTKRLREWCDTHSAMACWLEPCSISHASATASLCAVSIRQLHDRHVIVICMTVTRQVRDNCTTIARQLQDRHKTTIYTTVKRSHDSYTTCCTADTWQLLTRQLHNKYTTVTRPSHAQRGYTAVMQSFRLLAIVQTTITTRTRRVALRWRTRNPWILLLQQHASCTQHSSKQPPIAGPTVRPSTRYTAAKLERRYHKRDVLKLLILPNDASFFLTDCGEKYYISYEVQNSGE